MPKTPGPQPGPKPKRPKSGANGPGDKGPADGVRHRSHPAVPKGGKLPKMTGSMDPSKKGSK